MHIIASSIPAKYLIIDDVPDVGDVVALFHDLSPGNGSVSINCQKHGNWSMTWQHSDTVPASLVFLRWHTDCLCNELDPNGLTDRCTLTLIISAIKAALTSTIQDGADATKYGAFAHV